MASSPPSDESNPWVILHTVPRPRVRTCDRDLSFELDAVDPPRVSFLTFSTRPSSTLPWGTSSVINHPRIVSADLSASLFLTVMPTPHPPTASSSSSSASAATDICFLVLDAASGTYHRVPDPDPGLARSTFGVIAAPDAASFMVVTFWCPVGSARAWLYCFSSRTGVWVTKNVNTPRGPPRDWTFSDVIAHDGKLWWVDTEDIGGRKGLLYCDPFADQPSMPFVPFPYDITAVEIRAEATVYDYVQVADGMLRWVHVLNDAPLLSMYAVLGSGDVGYHLGFELLSHWRRDFDFGFIWASDTFKAAEMPNGQPEFALIDPNDADLLYFFMGDYLFGFDIRKREVLGYAPHGMADADVSSPSSLLAWKLPPALATPAARSHKPLTDGSKRPAGGLAPLLSLGEAAGMKGRVGEPMPLLPIGLAEDKMRRPPATQLRPPPKITIRTPELIAKAVQSNGAPPRRVLGETGSDDDDDPVALALRWRGVERDNYYDPHVHFFFYGRPKEDAHNQMWRRSPLVLHDAALVAAMDSVIHWGPGMRGRYLDVSELVTRLLRNHPGPISTLRIDSSQFPGIEEFTQWLSLLSEKQAGHVSFVNLTAAVDIELPLHQLYSQCLTYLSLSFVSIRSCLQIALHAAIEDGHPWCRLTHLCLTACCLLGDDLSKTVKVLWGLRKLRIIDCFLTEGCDESLGLEIESPYLISVQLQSCTVDTKLLLHATAMKAVTIGVRSTVNSSTSHPIHLHLCDRLCEMCGISLPYHDLRIVSAYTERGSLPYIKTLVLTVDMGTTGAQALTSLLCALPHLDRLTISSAHDSLQVGNDQEDFSQLDSVHGVANSLKHLILRRFRGTRKEVTFIIAVLAAAHSLVSVAIHPLATMPMSLAEAAEFFTSCDQVSRNCRIRLGPFV